jgi:hypothetical protein
MFTVPALPHWLACFWWCQNLQGLWWTLCTLGSIYHRLCPVQCCCLCSGELQSWPTWHSIQSQISCKTKFTFTLVQKLNPIWFPGDKDSIDRRGLLLSLYLRGGVLLAMITNLDFPWRRVLRVWRKPRQYLPDFITKDRRELILSTAFFCNK